MGYCTEMLFWHFLHLARRKIYEIIGINSQAERVLWQLGHFDLPRAGEAG